MSSVVSAVSPRIFTKKVLRRMPERAITSARVSPLSSMSFSIWSITRQLKDRGFTQETLPNFGTFGKKYRFRLHPSIEIGTVSRMATELTEFSLRVAGAVRAELARRNLPREHLIPVLGIGKNAVYARLRGEQSFEVEEVAKIAAHLGISVEDLVAVPKQLAVSA